MVPDSTFHLTCCSSAHIVVAAKFVFNYSRQCLLLHEKLPGEGGTCHHIFESLTFRSKNMMSPSVW